MDKKVKASPDSVRRTETPTSLSDNTTKMNPRVPGSSKKSIKPVKKNVKNIDNLVSVGNTLGMSEGLQAGLGAAGSVLGGLSTSGLTQEQASTREGIRSAINFAGPIGAASGVVDAIGSATGLNLDNIDADAAKEQVLVVKLPLKVLLIVFLVHPCLWVCLEVELRSLINLQKLIKWQMPMEDQLQILMPLKH